MQRPSKEDVDTALTWAEEFTGQELAKDLAAEVRALREQLHQQQQTHARQLREMNSDRQRDELKRRDPFGGF